MFSSYVASAFGLARFLFTNASTFLTSHFLFCSSGITLFVPFAEFTLVINFFSAKSYISSFFSSLVFCIVSIIVLSFFDILALSELFFNFIDVTANFFGWLFVVSIVTSISNVSVIFAYPSGASVSVIFIVCFPASVTLILSVFIVPSCPVTIVFFVPSGIVISNFAPANFFVLSCLSIFISCTSYSTGSSSIIFSSCTVTVIVFPLADNSTSGCVALSFATSAIYTPSLSFFVTSISMSCIILL